MPLKHRPGSSCEKCSFMLNEGHKALTDVWEHIKAEFEDAHLACVWRGMNEQQDAFLSGASKLPWPRSKHNRMVGAKKESVAMDIFRQDEDGIGHWDYAWYKEIADFVAKNDLHVIWGGTWKMRDTPHFELEREIYED